ncbi:MAG: hypothetical protein ABI548_28230 [Polyangiaceae bacterium]
MRHRYLLALALAGYLSPARAYAQTPSLSEPEVQAALHEQAHRARTYRYAWTGINGALAVGFFGLIPLVTPETRKDYIVSGVASTLGMLTTFVFPLNVEQDEAELDALEALPPAERRKKLGELLKDSADDEHSRVTWPWHLLNLGASAVTGSIIAVGFGHERAGIQSGILGFVLGELQIFTQPTSLVGARLNDSASLRWQPLVSVEQQAFSVGVSATF